MAETDGGDGARVHVRSFGVETGEYTRPVVVGAGATTMVVTGAARTPDHSGRALTVSAGVVLVLELAHMRLVVAAEAAWLLQAGTERPVARRYVV